MRTKWLLRNTTLANPNSQMRLPQPPEIVGIHNLDAHIAKVWHQNRCRSFGFIEQRACTGGGYATTPMGHLLTANAAGRPRHWENIITAQMRESHDGKRQSHRRADSQLFYRFQVRADIDKCHEVVLFNKRGATKVAT